MSALGQKQPSAKFHSERKQTRPPNEAASISIVFLFVRFDHQRKELVRQFLGRRVLLPQDHADLLLNFAVRRRPPRLRLRGL